MNKCLIIDKMHESILPLLADIGVEGDYRQDIGRDELLSIVNQYEGLIVRSKTTIDRAVISAGDKLKFVARAGAGVDQVDLKALDERGIVLLNAPEGNRDALAEHAIGMLLALLNKIHTADRDVHRLRRNRRLR
jgi:D-3-phosphoglycerate dehydrogenase / 2-oxoglutarate reductase